MKYFLIIFFTFLVISCSKNKIPKGILTPKEITPVLVELHIAESLLSQRHGRDGSVENYSNDLYLSILMKYKLDKKVFEQSVLYYGKHPETYRPIYDEVLNQLNELDANNRTQDSIRHKK